MTTKKKKRYPSLPGTFHVNIHLPTELHDAIKAIRQARREREMGDVKLSRIYREAVEQYINAEPQQQLLKEREERRSQPRTGREKREELYVNG